MRLQISNDALAGAAEFRALETAPDATQNLFTATSPLNKFFSNGMRLGVPVVTMCPMGDMIEADALVVIDLQEDYFQDPELARCRGSIVERCTTLARAAHEVGAPVVEVRTVHAPDRSTWTIDMLEDGQGMAIEGTPGAERLPELDLEPTVVVRKTRDSAFFGTDLAEHLRGVTRPAIVGVSTESCVRATASDAYAHDLRSVLVADATASVDAAEHDEVLRRLHEQYRLPVVDAAAIRFVAPADPGLEPVRS